MSFVVKELVAFKRGLTFAPAEFGALSQLFFDNVSTLLGILGALFAMTSPSFGVATGLVNSISFGKIVPGVGLTLVFGNVYYSWMATRMSRKYGRPYTAQPYGINTPAAFAFIFNIIFPAFFQSEGTPDERFIKAYRIALAANFVSGLISIVLSIPAPWLLKMMPPAALLVPIAGIGLTFLGIQQVIEGLAAPLVGYMAITWVFIGWYAGVRVGWRGFRVPQALQVILVGVALGWITGVNDSKEVEDAADLVKWYGPDWSFNDLFEDFGEIKDFLGTIIPLAVTATASSLMVLVSARNAGDPYPIREAMIVDGVGTMFVSLFGSPFGTVLYIGHPAYKKSGAKTGYSLINGVLFIIFSWFGIFALIRSVVNQPTIGPIILFVGLMTNEEALNFIPSRHYAAYLIGLFPSLCDWVVTVSDRSPLVAVSDAGEEYNSNTPGFTTPWWGVLAWQRGALLVSMLWVAMLVHVIDRKWLHAATWALIAALFAMFGIIHMAEAGFNKWADATWGTCVFDTNKVDCWDHGEQWQYFVAYMMLFATFGVIDVVGRVFEGAVPPPIESELKDTFNNWFDVPENEIKDGKFGEKYSKAEMSSSQEDPSTEGNSSINV